MLFIDFFKPTTTFSNKFTKNNQAGLQPDSVKLYHYWYCSCPPYRNYKVEERERERERGREKATLLKEDTDAIAASKRRKLKREHLPSGEAGEYSPGPPPPPPLSISLSQSYDGRDRGDRKGPIVLRSGYLEEPIARIHGKEVPSKMARRDTDPMYEWEDEKRQRAEQKRRHRK